MNAKACSQCREVKSLDDFPKEPRGKGGRRANCKACQSIRNREQYEAHRAKRLAYRKAQHAANREKENSRMRAYDAANRQAKLARLKAHREANREEAARRTRSWRKANPDRCRLYQQRKRARKMAIPYEDVDPGRIYLRDEGICGICGGKTDPADWHLDHIIPLARGGHHLYANVQVAHPFCNMSKGAREEVQVAA